MAIRVMSCAVAAALLLPAAVAAQSPTPAPEVVLTERVALPDGRGLALACSGPELTPHPVVLFEADLGRYAGSWAGVQAELPADIRACAYDRPGTGASDPVSGVRSPDDDLADLHAALDAAGVPAPYVLVADGAGAWWASAFDLAYPDDVVGAVFVDPVSPTRDEILRDALGEPAADEPTAVTIIRGALDDFLRVPDQTPGRADLRALASRARRLQLDDRPLVILEPARPTSALSRGTRPFGKPRPLVDSEDPWDATWNRVRDWALTRSGTITHRFVPGSEEIARQRPDTVVDAIMDVVAATGIDRAPGRAIARLRVPRSVDGVRRTERWIAVDDRSGTLTGVRVATLPEVQRIAGQRGLDTPAVRWLNQDRTRLGVAWETGSADCLPVARLMVDPDRMRVTIDEPQVNVLCTMSGKVAGVVLALRVPGPHGAPSAIRYEGLRTMIGTGPSRMTIDLPGAAGTDQVEVEDATGDLVSARPLRPDEVRDWWADSVERVRRGERGNELFLQWDASPCASWSRITLVQYRPLTIQEGATPRCDAPAVPTGVVLRFRTRVPSIIAAGRMPSAGSPPDGILIRQQAEAAAQSVSLVDYTVLGARLAQASDLDARILPPDRWVWAVALGNAVGNDVCPDGIAWDGPPCPNLSSLTVYIDAVTAELLGTVPGGF